MDLDSENENSKKGDSYEEQEQVVNEEKNEPSELVRLSISRVLSKIAVDV